MQFVASRLTLSNAPSGNASHLTTGHVSKSKGAIGRDREVIWHFLRLPRALYTAVIQNGRQEAKVCDSSIEEKQLIVRRK